MASSRIVRELSSYLMMTKVYPFHLKGGLKNVRESVVSFAITNANYEHKLANS